MGGLRGLILRICFCTAAFKMFLAVFHGMVRWSLRSMASVSCLPGTFRSFTEDWSSSINLSRSEQPLKKKKQKSSVS